MMMMIIYPENETIIETIITTTTTMIYTHIIQPDGDFWRLFVYNPGYHQLDLVTSLPQDVSYFIASFTT